MITNLCIISNIVVAPYMEIELKKLFGQQKKELFIYNILYDEYLSYKEQIKNSDLIVIILNIEEIYNDIYNSLISKKISEDMIINDLSNKCRELYFDIKQYSRTRVLWFGFEDYCFKYNVLFGNVFYLKGIVDKINLQIYSLLDEKDVFVDLKRIIAELGISLAYTVKGKYRWNAPYSKELISKISLDIYKQILVWRGCNRKCIVLDCDNTIWGGILSEDGINAIHIGENGRGKEYFIFQQFLLTLYYHGIILVICSKNDKEDVLEVFRKHSGMVLQEEHIAYFQCNWEDKPSNIKIIADKLNVGRESLIVIDDSKYEIESINAYYPEIKTILYNRNTIFDELNCLNISLSFDSDNIKNRMETYKSDIYRNILRENTTNFEDYIKALNLNIDIHETKNDEILRIAELTQRTNRCTNGKRYVTEKLYKQLSKKMYKLYTVRVSDKFSNLGIVGAIGFENNCCDLFSLSCRALGRGVEEKMSVFLKDNNINSIVFSDTKKNAELKKFLNSNHFIIIK